MTQNNPTMNDVVTSCMLESLLTSFVGDYCIDTHGPLKNETCVHDTKYSCINLYIASLAHSSASYHLDRMGQQLSRIHPAAHPGAVAKRNLQVKIGQIAPFKARLSYNTQQWHNGQRPNDHGNCQLQ